MRAFPALVLATFAIVSFPGLSLAQITNVGVTRTRLYQQVDASTPSTPFLYRASVIADTQTPGIVTAATVDPPGPTPTINLAHDTLIGDLLSASASFSSDTDLNNAFPNGAYAFTFSGGSAPAGSFNLNAAFPAYAPQVPTLSAAAIANLNTVIPGQTIPITLTGTAGGSLFALLVDPLDNSLHGAISLGSAGVTSFAMPTMLSGTPILPYHSYELRFTLTVSSPVNQVPVPGWPDRFESAASQIETHYAFTSIPSPAALPLILGAGALLRRRTRAI